MKLAKDKRAVRAQVLSKRRSRARMSSWSDENKARVARAEQAMGLYLKGGRRPAQAVVDILSDLRHYCDAYGINYLQHYDIAGRNYLGQVLELI